MQWPDPESLRCFVAVAVHLNFRAAANSVHLSAAALGQRIARLEEVFGVRLFERTTRRVMLTQAGARMLPVVKSLLEQIADLQSIAQEVDGSGPFELVIGTRFELGLSWIVPSLSKLKEARPERSLHLSFGDSGDMLARLEQGIVDASVTSARAIPAGMRFEALHPEEYCLVVATELAQAPGFDPSTSPQDLPLLDLSSDLPLFRYYLDAHDEVDPWSFPRIEYLGTIAAVLYRVLEGAGVAVLPQYFANEKLEAGCLTALGTDLALGKEAFRLVWHEGHPFETEIKQLAAELRALPLRG
ncbi:MAG: LysR family glycine cleavage system transcriptional activator [Planctomycetota bacterium]|jgi:LysR family glycine cleavage system transcriptional activator